MLLAEANQWPEDAAAYFGRGDECQMNFHFPIMPRIFMSIHMEDRLPIADILAQTPQIPANCQWALFLRNHDELTLEMVTDEERDYMYRAFAHEPTMRINLGIRRRLAPLVGNDRRQVELMNALLMSLPGTPVLYYGDEIGMGDNVFLGDRNGVRTPMQWSPDRNAGFSRANPQRLVLPVIIDPEYHYESLNVEAQQGNPNSLLWWMKRLIAMRKRFQAFGRGSIEFLSPENPKVLAFIRRFEEETVLVVANLSRFTQYVELDLRNFKGNIPIELIGKTRFPTIGELPYLLTLGEHAFSWFSLEEPKTAAQDAREASYQPPLLEVPSGWEGPLTGGERSSLEMVLPAWLEGRRWFHGRAREISQVRGSHGPGAEVRPGPHGTRSECADRAGVGSDRAAAAARRADHDRDAPRLGAEPGHGLAFLPRGAAPLFPTGPGHQRRVEAAAPPVGIEGRSRGIGGPGRRPGDAGELSGRRASARGTHRAGARRAGHSRRSGVRARTVQRARSAIRLPDEAQPDRKGPAAASLDEARRAPRRAGPAAIGARK